MELATRRPFAGMPRLSAILNMPGEFDAIRKTIRHLCAQSVRDQLELIIVATPEKAARIDATSLDALGASQLLTVPRMPTAAAGWVAGIQAARAPVVVLCEDHSYPEPHWAEALIEAHERDYAAVGPAMRNGNPGSLISWANFLLCFIEWSSLDRSQLAATAPGHNTSYKRDILLAYPDLERRLVSERLLHFDLGAKGHHILLEPRAATNHVNISRAGSYLAHSFYGGRVFGGGRAQEWPKIRAWACAFGFPLVPLIRLRRILKLLDSPAKRRESRFWAALPWIMAGLALHALGEAAGYTLGPGAAMDRYMSFELRRAEHVNAADKALLKDVPAFATAAHSAF
ncbi:MAG: glycosyltransferase [Bryobacteraceae bacterium]|nr:glycosyltransferase [Bryobacteraceae bacterium]